MISRDVWDRVPTLMELALEPSPSDGVVAVTRHRTVRMKQPTVDVLYLKGKMSALKDGVLVDIVDGYESMEEGLVYEMVVDKGQRRRRVNDQAGQAQGQDAQNEAQSDRRHQESSGECDRRPERNGYLPRCSVCVVCAEGARLNDGPD